MLHAANKLRTCPDCGKAIRGGGNFKRHKPAGQPCAAMRSTALDRFMAKIATTASGCWVWGGYITKEGYGRFSLDQTMVYAHRAGWELLRGEILEGLQLDHLCRNRACVNPDHLEPVTPAVNVQRADLKGRAHCEARREQTHCKNGHEFTAENTYTYRGSRQCIACKREGTRRRRSQARHQSPREQRAYLLSRTISVEA